MSEELPHVRCITCGKILANKWEDYQRMLEQGVSIEKALDELGLNRYCCRIRMMNPIKYVKKGHTVFDDLSLSIDQKVSTSDTLNAMSSTAFTVVPEEDEIQLPALPALPTLSEKKPLRSYKAI